MNRAFVTGGSGFVGRNLIEALVSRGVEVRALARSDDAASTVESLGAEAVRGDLDAKDVMASAMNGCDAAFHAAAQVTLGVLYFNGEGVERDYAAAFGWFNVAATNGRSDAANSGKRSAFSRQARSSASSSTASARKVR